MTLDHNVKRKLCKAIVIGSAILLFCAGSVFSSVSALNMLRKKNDDAIARIIGVEQSIRQLHREKNRIVAALDIIKRNVTQDSGRRATTLHAVKGTIDNLMTERHIRHLRAYKSSWKKFEGAAASVDNRSIVVTSRLLLSFEAFTDFEAVLFLLGIMNDLPGYLDISSISMTRNGRATEDYIERVARDAGVEGLIKVEVYLAWYARQDMDYDNGVEA